MSLSNCEKCGGHIPLGPDATNRCEKCGAGVFSPAEPFAWWLYGSREIFLASEFAPDTEHRDEWVPLYR